MKIVILGAGQVGTSVAESLVSEANEITVVDTDLARLARLQDRLDLRIVVGNAALPSVLEQAGMADADLLIAVTQSDQTNLCACRTAATLFKTPTKIARLRSPDYARYPQLLEPKNFAVDFSICPEQIVTDYIVKLHRVPRGAAGPGVRRRAGEPGGGARHSRRTLVGHPVADLRRHIPDRGRAHRRHLPQGPAHHPGRRDPDRGRRRGLLPGGHPRHPSGLERVAPARQPDPAHHDRRRRQHRGATGRRHPGSLSVKLIEADEARARTLGAA